MSTFNSGTNTGLQYGLTIRKKPSQHARPSSSARPHASNNNNSIFGFNDDDDDDRRSDDDGNGGTDDRRSTAPHYLQKSMSRQQLEVQRKALEEDPSVFEYDSVYDREVQQQRDQDTLRRSQRHQRPLYEQKSLYVGQLKKKAEERRREEEARRERQLAKMAEEERRKMGDDAGPVYVTSAYRMKLQEMERQREAEKQAMEREEQEQRRVLHRGMGSFYMNLLGRNEALGARRTSTVSSVGVEAGVDAADADAADDDAERRTAELSDGRQHQQSRSRWDSRHYRSGGGGGGDGAHGHRRSPSSYRTPRGDEDYGDRQRRTSLRSSQRSGSDRRHYNDDHSRHRRHRHRSYDDDDERHDRDRRRYGDHDDNDDGERYDRSRRRDGRESRTSDSGTKEATDPRTSTTAKLPKTEQDASIEMARQRALQRIAERRQKNTTT